MKVIKKKTNCLCHHCDSKESKYIISHGGSFKLYWASTQKDCEIAFCEDCARDLLKQLTDVLDDSNN